MAVATTTAALIAAGLAAGGTAAGAKMQAGAAGKATQAQRAGQQEALQFEREKELRRQRDYDAAQAQYREQWDAWNAMRSVLAERYGLNLGTSAAKSFGAPGGGGGTPGAPAAAAPTGQGGMVGPSAGRPMTLGQIVQGARDPNMWAQVRPYAQ